jgi:hypothetical protein
MSALRAMRLMAISVMLTVGVVAFPSAAHASHTHAKVVGNGKCVVLAEGAGEAAVVLPDAVFTNNPNVDATAGVAGRSHPLHVLVHLGVPGDHLHLYVLGSPAEKAACSAGYVNR